MEVRSRHPILKAEAVTKRYPGTLALDRVDFSVYAGAVNVLIGENGAGKSTLMRILAGAELPSEGRLLLDGVSVRLESPRAAARLGIGIIHQELTLFPNLSVAENIFCGREITTSLGVVRHGEQEKRASEVLKRLELDVAADRLVEDLRIGPQQLVEIARALASDVRVLIMDEPTSALSAGETEVLFRIIGELTAQGVAVVYISHKLDECLRIGDVFTVLRDGRKVAEGVRSEVDLTWIVERMTGRKAGAFYTRREREPGDPLLAVESLSLPRPHGDGFLVDGVSFTLHAGEVLGLFGLMGSGRTELLESLYGLHEQVSGRIRLGDRDISALHLEKRLEAGLALVPEDRQRQGLVQEMSVSQNVTLANLSRLTGWYGLSPLEERKAVARYREELAIRLAHPGQPVNTLSGGNQQKVVIAKNLLTAPRVLLMDEPTRGIDVGAKSDILELVATLAGKGLGILFVSSEAREVAVVSDRVLVLARGRVVTVLSRDEITEQALLEAAVRR